jgi:DNA-binding SARP family transcriptional activator/tetratricopeptide (TPR) repeat protein
VELELLGPIRVLDDTGERPVAGRQQALLGLLAIESPGVVSADRLVEAVWPDGLPRNPANALQGRVSQLRKALARDGESPIAQRGSGYALELDAGSIDARRFEELATAGHHALQAADPATAAALLGEAVSLWRGDALEGFANEPWAVAEAARLEELRLGAVEDRLAASLELGEHDRLVPQLEAFVHRHPLRERLRGQLMLALYRSARQADALEVFQQGRRLLLDELGIDPSQPLRELERRILEQDPALDRQTATPKAQTRGNRPPEPKDIATPPASEPAAASLAVGRDAESTALLDAWDDATGGSGSLVVLTGEPGIGKSHLVEALATRVRRSMQAPVVIGRCAETEGAPPFWPWIQVVRTLVGELEADTLHAALGVGAPYVAQIVPEVRGRLAEATIPVSADATTARFAICDAIATFLCRVAATEPMLVVLEDLHQADDPSLDLLDLLAEQVATSTLLVVATARETGTNERLDASLSRLAGRSSATRLALEGLSEAALTDLTTRRLGSSPGDEVVQALHARTGGNPLFATELLQLAAPGGDAAAARVLAEVPRTLREVIGRRLQSLSPECRDVLAAAAVIGRDAPVGWLAAMLELDPATVLDLLEPAAAAGIVGETDGWLAGYRFEHVLIRDVVVAELPARRRAQLHAAIADVLSGLPDDRALAAVAHHRRQAAPLGQVGMAIDASIAAADQAARIFAVEQAEGHLQDALGLVESYGDETSRELSIHARLAFLLQETDGFLSPRVREAADRVRALAGRITDAPEVIGVIYSLWAYWMNRARYDQAMEIAEELVTAGTEADDLAASIAGHFTRGQTRSMLGSPRDAEPDLLTAAALVDQLDERESEQRGIAQVVLDARVGLGHPLWLLGRDGEAEAAIRSAMTHADRTTNHYAAAHSRLFMCWLTALRQDAESTLAWSTQTVELCATHGFGLIANVVGPFQGWAMAATGDPAHGIERIVAALDELDAGGFQMLRPLHLGLLAEAFELGGRREEAHRSVDDAIATAERTSELMHLAELRRQRALLTADRTDTVQLRAELEAARELARAQGAVALIERIDRDLSRLEATA